jgi:NAD binding domain of 6-phosphogluconate dehydrogenase
MGDSGRTVTVLGLGRMGLALAQALACAGYDLTVWNRTESRSAPLRELDVALAGSVESACASSEVVVVSVTDYAATREMLGEIGSVLEGHTLIQLSSGTPSEARAMAGWAAAQGIDYVDGAIVGFPSAIGTADAIIFYAVGRRSGSRRCRGPERDTDARRRRRGASGDHRRCAHPQHHGDLHRQHGRSGHVRYGGRCGSGLDRGGGG